MSAPVVGFDLDMTLIDSRAGIAATYRALTVRTGVYVDTDAVVARLGPPLRDEIANWFPAGQVDEAVRIFRELYPTYGIEPCVLLPGAAAAVQSVRSGGQVVVVTSKLAAFARSHLAQVRLAVDAVAGERFGAGKVAAIREHGVQVYVGDHIADVQAARSAGVTAVGVATGPYRAADLADAGAHAVLPDLRDFPPWWASWRAGECGPTGRGLGPSLRAVIAADATTSSG